MSVLGNAKSNRHRKTHQVEPGGADPNMFMHLTRGGLHRESGAEVSRGRSSEEARRKAGGAKGQRTAERAPATGLRSAGEQTPETRRALQLRQPTLRANAGTADGLRRRRGGGRRVHAAGRKEAAEGAQ